MSLIFSQRPGRHERHLMRKRDNPLFPGAERHITSARLLDAQKLDHEELEGFIGAFHKLVYETANLEPNCGSEVILDLKERLDKAYEQSAGLADDQTDTQAAIVKLIAVVMKAVRAGAGDDPVALRELDQEELARSAHFALLAQPLVADLLSPDSPIAEEELAATLLSCSAADFDAALTLFDAPQRELLHRQAQALLDAAGDSAPAAARDRLAVLRP